MRWPNGPEDAFLKSLDFGQDFLGLGFAFQIQELRILIVLDPQPVLDRVEHLEDSGEFVFREQVDVQIEVGPVFGLFAQSILADENEG